MTRSTRRPAARRPATPEPTAPDATAPDAGEPTEASGLRALIPGFDLAGRGTTPLREVIAGVTTFLAIAGVLVQNATILSSASIPGADPTQAATQPFLPVSILVAGALIAAVGSIALGLVANLPVVIAANVAVVSVVAYDLAPGLGAPGVMGLVAIEGIVFTVLVLAGLREPVLRAVPPALRTAIVVGTGFLLLFVGLFQARLLEPIEGGTVVAYPTTWAQAAALVAIAVGLVLTVRRVPGAALASIAVALGLGVIVTAAGLETIVELPATLTTQPRLELVGVDLTIVFAGRAVMPVVLMTLFVFLVSHASVSMASLVAVSDAAGLTDAGRRVPRLGTALVVDGLSSIAGGLLGAGNQGIRPESATGVADGGRTGLSAIVAGLLCLTLVAIGPLVSVIQPWMIAPAFILGGIFLIRRVTDLRIDDPADAIPAILTLIVASLDIAAGIGLGFIAWTGIRLLTGRFREVHVLTWAIAAAYVLFFARTALIGYF